MNQSPRETEMVEYSAMNSSVIRTNNPGVNSGAYGDSNDAVDTFVASDYNDDRDHANVDGDASATSTLSSISGEAKWSVGLFSVCTVLLFADQNLMAPNLTAIANNFGFDEEERDKKLGGEIALAFFVLGAPASYVIGCLGDTYNRSILFAATVGIGEGSCLLTAFCHTYNQLYAARATTGFALGGALPLIYSVLGDLFSADQRHFAGSIVGVGTGLGILLGQSVAGFLGPTFGWRLPFVVVSVPALFCALLVLLTVKDPPRGQMEAASLQLQREQQQDENRPFVNQDDSESPSENGVEMPSSRMTQQCPQKDTHRQPQNSIYSDQSGNGDDGDDGSHVYHPHLDGAEEDVAQPRSLEGSHEYLAIFRGLLSTPTVICCLLQGAPGCVPWGIVNTFLNDFMSEDKGMTVEGATTVALVFGLGNFFGLMLGGAGGSYLYRKDCRYPAILAGTMAMASCFPFWYLINMKRAVTSSPILWIGAIMLGFFSGGTGPIVKATLQNVTLPQARGQAFAMFNTFDDFGRGLGPVFVSALIVNLGGRQPAFNVGVFGWMICGFVNLLIFFTVVQDEEKIQTLVRQQLTHHTPSD